MATSKMAAPRHISTVTGKPAGGKVTGTVSKEIVEATSPKVVTDKAVKGKMSTIASANKSSNVEGTGIMSTEITKPPSTIATASKAALRHIPTVASSSKSSDVEATGDVSKAIAEPSGTVATMDKEAAHHMFTVASTSKSSNVDMTADKEAPHHIPTLVTLTRNHPSHVTGSAVIGKPLPFIDDGISPQPGTAVWTCTSCGMNVPTSRTVLHYLHYHHDPPLLSCSECGFRGEIETDVRFHISSAKHYEPAEVLWCIDKTYPFLFGPQADFVPYVGPDNPTMNIQTKYCRPGEVIKRYVAMDWLCKLCGETEIAWSDGIMPDKASLAALGTWPKQHYTDKHSGPPPFICITCMSRFHKAVDIKDHCRLTRHTESGIIVGPSLNIRLPVLFGDEDNLDLALVLKRDKNVTTLVDTATYAEVTVQTEGKTSATSESTRDSEVSMSQGINSQDDVGNHSTDSKAENNRGNRNDNDKTTDAKAIDVKDTGVSVTKQVVKDNTSSAVKNFKKDDVIKNNDNSSVKDNVTGSVKDNAGNTMDDSENVTIDNCSKDSVLPDKALKASLDDTSPKEEIESEGVDSKDKTEDESNDESDNEPDFSNFMVLDEIGEEDVVIDDSPTEVEKHIEENMLDSGRNNSDGDTKKFEEKLDVIECKDKVVQLMSETDTISDVDGIPKGNVAGDSAGERKRMVGDTKELEENSDTNACKEKAVKTLFETDATSDIVGNVEEDGAGGRKRKVGTCQEDDIVASKKAKRSKAKSSKAKSSKAKTQMPTNVCNVPASSVTANDTCERINKPASSHTEKTTVTLSVDVTKGETHKSSIKAELDEMEESDSAVGKAPVEVEDNETGEQSAKDDKVGDAGHDDAVSPASNIPDIREVKNASIAEQSRADSSPVQKGKREKIMSPSGKIHECPECGKKCKSMGGLTSHRRVHKK